MAKKQMMWKTKGMNKDFSVSAFNPEFSFDNQNLRLSTHEGNTLMSWVNEKGTALINNLEIDNSPWEDGNASGERADNHIVGTPVGTAVINHQLVIFTTNSMQEDTKPDRIYVLWWYDPDALGMQGKLLYHGNLGFDVRMPLETLVSYEASHIQKVYWLDGYHQPRMINIAADASIVKRWNSTDGSSVDTFFDFVPALKLKDSLKVEQSNISGGIFAPGTIQYCYTYSNKYGQQSNVVGISPLFYLSHSDRGASPEEKVSSVFTITITHADQNFDNVRLYSIHRTSRDATPLVKLLEVLPISSTKDDVTLQYTDTGTTGSTIDPAELLYAGGYDIQAYTMTEKDHTLFLGNIKQKNFLTKDIQEAVTEMLQDKYSHTYVEFKADGAKKKVDIPTGNSLYHYDSTLNHSQAEATTFKGGEIYRLGFQLQKTTGEWSMPIYLGDFENTKYPTINSAQDYGNDEIYLPYGYCELDMRAIDEKVDLSAYKKIRPVIVYPTIGDRQVLCQGVLNPTVFNAEDRISGTPTVQSSWFFRPYPKMANVGVTRGPSGFTGNDEGTYLTFNHYQSLPAQEALPPHNDDTYSDTSPSTSPSTLPGVSLDTENARFAQERDDYISGANIQKGVEIQGAAKTYSWVDSQPNDWTHSNTQFFVDQSILTFHSPDVDFDTEVQSYAFGGLKMRIVGMVPITSSVSSHHIKTSSSMLELGSDKNAKYGGAQDFGSGERNYNVLHYNYSTAAHKSLVSDFLWNDALVYVNDTAEAKTLYPFYYMIFPWHRSGSLNSDPRPDADASSLLDTKKESHLLFSMFSEYFKQYETGGTIGYSSIDYPNISAAMVQAEDHVFNTRLDKQSSRNSYINYYANIDKVLYNRDGYYSVLGLEDYKNVDDKSSPNIKQLHSMLEKNPKLYSPISMKYKSTAHVVVALQAAPTDTDSDTGYNIPLTPAVYGESNGKKEYIRYNSTGNISTFWNETLRFKQDEIDIMNFASKDFGFLWLAELYKESSNPFGGTSAEALASNNWLIGGETVDLFENDGHRKENVHIYWTYGDTYYQRYDCLKTYPYTEEDPNQLTEILSFMCETHVNIDGRYDRNRGQTDNTAISPKNFNLLNDVYSQQGNFFQSKILNVDNKEAVTYPNQIFYTKTKQSGADLDLWANVTLGSILELEGDKGALNSLQRFNDQIIAFQDNGISQILYNENVQIASSQNVPIEIANSDKVQGARYLSNSIGCRNKWSIVSTPSGLYFIDSDERSIYTFNGQLTNLSVAHGFDSWSKQNIYTQVNPWNPDTFTNFVSYYDKQNQEVLFINKDTALAYSEKFGLFTSFYSYGGVPYLCNLEDAGIWISPSKAAGSEDTYHLWKHQSGNYCQFFDVTAPYSMTLIGNPEPTLDKTFTNLEFRACVEGEGTFGADGNFTPMLPFDSLEVWNEYQHGVTSLSHAGGRRLFQHHASDGVSSLKRKFRIWRCDIPRDNFAIPAIPHYDSPTEEQKKIIATAQTQRTAALKADAVLGVSRTKAHPIDRMRNPWLYLKLKKGTDTAHKTEIHDVVMTYFD